MVYFTSLFYQTSFFLFPTSITPQSLWHCVISFFTFTYSIFASTIHSFYWKINISLNAFFFFTGLVLSLPAVILPSFLFLSFFPYLFYSHFLLGTMCITTQRIKMNNPFLVSFSNKLFACILSNWSFNAFNENTFCSLISLSGYEMTDVFLLLITSEVINSSKHATNRSLYCALAWNHLKWVLIICFLQDFL